MKKWINLSGLILLSVFLLFGCVTAHPEESTSEAKPDSRTLVIVHTNDAHCSIDPVENDDPNLSVIGYEGVLNTYQNELLQYQNVIMADAGDHFQGSPMAMLSKGTAIIRIMNEMGYTVATVGNHEFDYGANHLLSLTNENYYGELHAEFPYVCANMIYTDNGEPVYKPYYIQNCEVEENGKTIIKKVAFIGLTTPQTILLGSKNNFCDEDGNILYDFLQDDETGEQLYALIQKYIDEASEEADYCILLGHIGQQGIEDIWRSDTIVKHITGVKSFIDGHSHEAYIQMVEDKEGKDVVISQTGVNLNAVGVMKLDLITGEVKAEVIQSEIRENQQLHEFIAEIKEENDKLMNTEIAETEITFYAQDKNSGTPVMGYSDTNLGNLLADIMREELDADIAFVSASTIKQNLDKGKITYGMALALTPYGNTFVKIRASGQQILDALENSVSQYPESSSRFLQVSGLSFDFTYTGDNTRKNDETASVSNVRIHGEPLNPDQTYTVAGSTFILVNNGLGYSMFRDCEVISTAKESETQIIINYFKNIGTITEDNSTAQQEDRIRLICSSEPVN